MIGSGFRAGCLAAGLALSTGAASALDGTVVDEAGKPIEGAQVCYYQAQVEQLCSETDAKGHFDLPNSRLSSLRVTAPDFLALVVSATPRRTPIALERAPTLSVRLVQVPGGKPIEKGEVTVIYPTGVEKGPFPIIDASGVLIRRILPAGEVRVMARAEGFAQRRPRPVVLEAGVKTEVIVELSPEAQTPAASAGGDQ